MTIYAAHSFTSANLLTTFLLFSSLAFSLPHGSSERLSQQSNATELHGWTDQPDGRGTLDILWSCLFTIFLCSWAVLCLNVPAETDDWWKPIWRKFGLTGLGILGPEFILQSALGQWISARTSVKDFRALGFDTWTMSHAFFADMGGFFLDTPERIAFPINAKQLHYLVKHGYLPLPCTTKKEIKDRNKVDALLRVITVLQTLWFMTNCVGRAVQDLTITTFELTTVGFIFCTLGTHLCWAHKPADVEVPVTLYCKTPLKRILLEAGDLASHPYIQTPLDFASRQEWSWSLWWHLMLNVVRKLGIRFRPTVRPITRMPNDDWPYIPPAGVFALGCVDIAYAGIYVAGWNFTFATPREQQLWRISTAVILGVVVAYLFVESYTFWLLPALPPQIRKYLVHDATVTAPRDGQVRKRLTGLGRALDWMRNSSPTKDPQLYIPLKASIPITLAGFVYLFARAYIVVECFLALRLLPADAYKTVDWSSLLPHV